MRLFCLLTFAAFLAGCGGASRALIPAAPQGAAAPSTANSPHLLSDGTATTAGNGATGLPGGNGATGLPGGNGATGLPGALLACSPVTLPGQAACTIALNINIPPLSDLSTPSSLLPGLHPSDLQNAYKLPSGQSGGTVAIVDAYDDPLAETDLSLYRTAYGLPPCTTSNGCFRKVNEQGAAGSYPSANSAWGEEISLDLDVVSAACPKCSLVLVEANSAQIDDLGAAVDTAATLGANAISNSYYAAEWSGETSEDAHYRHPGIAITASSGDQAAPFYPAASQYVTAVGGTTLSGSAGSWNESPWAYGGQGCSAYIPRPTWQKNICKSRATVDVAAVADPQTGVSMYDSLAGGWLVAGGTSIGAPLIASAYALSGNPAGPAYSYANRNQFNDISPSGYDAATGLGSPNGVGGF
jgi:subtilase family serine protease